jgi:excisionase family DNA binding protein
MRRATASAAPAILDREGAAAYLGISTDTLDRLRAAGVIPWFRVSGRLVRFRVSDLEAYIDRQTVAAAANAALPKSSGRSGPSKTDIRAAAQRAHEAVLRLRRSSEKLR